MENLIDRMRAAIESQTDAHRRFKELEERTGLKATAWQNFWNGRQRPTWEMIELVAKTWPQFAFWIATGIDDDEHGHQRISPYHPTQTRASAKYFAAKIVAKDASDRFDAAMRRAHLVQETTGDMAGHARYEFAPEDANVFGEQIRAGATEREAFIEREEEDKNVVADAVTRYRGMKRIEDPDQMRVYAPITGKQ